MLLLKHKAGDVWQHTLAAACHIWNDSRQRSVLRNSWCKGRPQGTGMSATPRQQLYCHQQRHQPPTHHYQP
jgi:hypothetical protein